MPTPYIKKLHEETGKPIAKLEQYWEEAKKGALKRFGRGDKDVRYYPYVMSILKKRAYAKTIDLDKVCAILQDMGITAYKEENHVITAKYHNYKARKIKVYIAPENYILVDNIRFDWNENGGKRIYTHTYPNGDTLSFVVNALRDRGNIINVNVNDLPMDGSYAKISGKDSPVKETLLHFLKARKVRII